MTSFEDLCTALQVGVRRADPMRFEPLSDWTGSSAEHTCLVEAGTLDLMRRAGAKSRGDIAPLEAAPAETGPYAYASTGPILEALEAGCVEAVLEWAEKAASRGRLAPPGTLVALLQLGPKQRRALQLVFGTRAWWLAALMEVDLPIADPTEGRTGPEDWAVLDWKERLEWIIAVQPTPENEPLLATALADPRKEVREASARLLARLPQSSFAREVMAAAKGRVQVERKLLSRVMAVSPPAPEELPKGLPRTGGQSGMGPRALALYDLARFVPVSFWEQECGLDPSDLLALAEKSDHADALVEGWFLAATDTFQDVRWCDALLKSVASGARSKFWPVLCARSSNAAFESAIRTLKAPSLEDIAQRPGKLTSSLSALAVELAKKLPYAGAKSLAGRLDLSVLSSLSEPWPDPSEPTRQHWHRIIDLRKRLLQSLDL